MTAANHNLFGKNGTAVMKNDFFELVASTIECLEIDVANLTSDFKKFQSDAERLASIGSIRKPPVSAFEHYDQFEPEERLDRALKELSDRSNDIEIRITALVIFLAKNKLTRIPQAHAVCERIHLLARERVEMMRSLSGSFKVAPEYSQNPSNDNGVKLEIAVNLSVIVAEAEQELVDAQRNLVEERDESARDALTSKIVRLKKIKQNQKAFSQFHKGSLN